jgi:hypothetical protein
LHIAVLTLELVGDGVQITTAPDQLLRYWCILWINFGFKYYSAGQFVLDEYTADLPRVHAEAPVIS